MGKRVKKKDKAFRNTILVLLVLFFVLNIFRIPVFNSFGLTVSKYFLLGRDVVFAPLNTVTQYFQSKDALIQENEELQKELIDLKIVSLTNDVLENQYQELLSFSEDGTSKALAKVLLKPPYSSFDTLIVTGDFSAISDGTKVFYKNIILGEISEHTSDVATVRLYSASGNTSVAQLESGEQIDVIGRGSGMYEILLPKDIEISEGDLILFPDQDIVMFGVVNAILESQDDLFNEVLFNIPIDFRDINFVEL